MDIRLGRLLVLSICLAGLLPTCSVYKPTLAECQLCFTGRRSPENGIPPACRNCFEIRTRDPNLRTDLRKQYSEEYAYIESRRRGLQVLPQLSNGSAGNATPQNPPGGLIGVSLSGGGIRSASFSLGVMQALELNEVLSQVDYLSAVSGGGYLAGWLQAHAGTTGTALDHYGYEIRAKSDRGLFENDGDHVEHLRTHTGFLNDGSWQPLARLIGQWAIRWPAHVIFDDILHWRAFWSWPHIIDIYKGRIEATYFRGKPHDYAAASATKDTRLIDINDPDRASVTPYTILNANLAHPGDSQVGVTYPDRAGCAQGHDQWHFELTRDFVGSDATGYVDASAFGQSIVRVRRDTNGHPAAVVVNPHTNDGNGNFRLSEAVAASGAAFDSAVVAYHFDVPVLTEIGQLIAASLLNLHLGVEVQNFARQYDGWSQLLDYLRMVTYQRDSRFWDPGTRWLYITDGGHYENLGVLALLRRGTQCIVSFDATADGEHQFDDLFTLLKRIECDLGLDWHFDPQSPRIGNDGHARYRIRVTRRDEPSAVVATILYVKANSNLDLPHMTERLNGETQQQASGARLQRQVDRVRDVQLELVRRFAEAAGKSHPESWSDSIRAPLMAAYKDLEDLLIVEQRTGRVQRDLQAAKLDEINLQETQVIRLEQSIEASQRAQDSLGTVLKEWNAPSAPPGATPQPVNEQEIGSEQKIREQIDVLENAAPARVEQLQQARATLDQLRYDYRTAFPGSDPFDRAVELSNEILDLVDAVLAEIGGPTPSKQLRAARVGARFAFDDRLKKLRRDARSWERFENARNERIRKVAAFDDGDSTFPHTGTLRQWYKWEQFEAYRMLGYQEASTYVSRLVPKPDPDIGWCTFAPDEVASSQILHP